MVKHADQFSVGGAARRRRFQDVVALVRIERAVLAAEDRLIINRHRRAAAHVVGQIGRTAEVRVPRIARQRIGFVKKPGRGQVKIVAGEELRFRRSRGDHRLGNLSAGANGAGECEDGGETRGAHRVTHPCAPKRSARRRASLRRRSSGVLLFIDFVFCGSVAAIAVVRDRRRRAAARQRPPGGVRHAASFSSRSASCRSSWSMRFLTSGKYRNSTDAFRHSR